MSPLLVRSLPFGLYIAMLVLESLLPGWVADFDVRWLYPVKVGVVALALCVVAALHRAQALCAGRQACVPVGGGWACRLGSVDQA